ncbi:MAG: S8 family serine peptidase [bacterium]
MEFKPGNPIFDATIKGFSPRALRRRASVIGSNQSEKLISIEDAPVWSRYLDSLNVLGINIQATSSWANAVSAYLDSAQLRLVRKLFFVSRVSPIATAHHGELTYEEINDPFLSTIKPLTEIPTVLPIPQGYDSIIFHYGLTDTQLTRINVPPLHAMGFDGSGVLLGFLDVGFRWKVMETTKMHNVVAEYDFINHDSLPANDSLDAPDQDGHGSIVLSAATGFFPDTIIGPAYNADLILAKTEDVRSEKPIEEDNYAAGLEWMEKMGVDVTSCSLGYFGFDSEFTSHTYSDMDGRTTVAARAAARSAGLGVLNCSAMGNGGNNSGYPYLITPADADSIISVGALEENDTIANFSSRGPTSDHRIKPEICAPGVKVHTWSNNNSFAAATGTSLATPLISGGCALIKQTHPEASAQAIRNAVMKTGIRTNILPDTAYGYGRLDAYQAALALGTIIGPRRTWRNDSIHYIEVGIAANNHVRFPVIRYSYGVFNSVFNLHLATDSLIYTGTFPTLKRGTHVRYFIETNDGADTLTHSPRNAPDSMFEFNIGDTTIDSHIGVVEGSEISDISIWPNPTRGIFTVQSYLTGATSIRIIDAVGRTMLQYAMPSEIHQLRINVSTYPPGVYELESLSHYSQKVSVQKLIVLP